MELSAKELWTVVHGMALGAVFLLAFAGGLAGLWSLKKELVTEAGTKERMRRMIPGIWIMTVAAWLTVIIGTYVVYPWYRAKPPATPKHLSALALRHYPRSSLLAKPTTAEWHKLGMEWKEHVGWIAPILATAVALVITRYRRQLVYQPKVRRMLVILYSLAFFSAAVAGLFGAFINKAAPTR